MKTTIRFFTTIFILCAFYAISFSQASLTIANVNGTAGNPVSLSIQATGISDMVGFQFTIAYDNTKLTYVDCTNWGGGTNASAVQVTSLAASGRVTFVYVDEPVNISSGKFFDINFTVKSGATGSSLVSWSDNPTLRELSNSIPVEITCNYTDGGVTISTGAHYVPVGDPTQAMNITLLEVKFDGIDLVAGDEVGIFDGDLCVGSYVLTRGLGELNDALVGPAKAYGAEAGTTEGFIPGHPVTYRFWDQSEGLEITNVAASCYSNQQDPVNCPVFEVGASAFVQLIGNSGVTQQISYKTGWGIFSSYVIPPPGNIDMKDLFQPRIDDGSLIKVQDEDGNSLEDYGFFGGWVNNIGNISPSEGYKVKMTAACILPITGSAAPLPFTISLKGGWNIMGYPRSTEADALAIVQQLIDRNTLIKVQDESGNSLEDYGVFGGWTNNIGNFIPGKGYKIKLVTNDVLTVAAVYPAAKSAGIPQNDILRTSHFRPVGVGNGIDHMNINVVGLPLGLLQSGDEIAVYDGNLCVGATVIRNPQSAIQNISIPVSASDGPDCPGFTEGHSFSLRIWKSQPGEEYSAEPDMIKGISTFRKNESAFVSLAKYAEIGFSKVPVDQGIEVRCFPNPFSEKMTIELKLAETSEVTVTVFNLQGREIRHILPGTCLSSGICYFNWDGRNDAGQEISQGIYYLKITAGSRVNHAKIVLLE